MTKHLFTLLFPHRGKGNAFPSKDHLLARACRPSLIILAFLLAANGVSAERRQPIKPGKKVKEVVAAHTPKKNASDALFATNAPLRTFNIEVNGTELAALQKNVRAYVRGRVSIDQQTFADVGVHLKGNGSFRPLNEKPSLVIKFDRYVPDRKFCGLTRIALNNSSQDATYLADFMANAMFADANVPVSRVTHARVKFNGRDLGLYVLVEAHNKEFLKRWFRNTDGNLYEAYLQDIDQQIDQDHGNDKSQNDRKRLAEVTKIADPAERWTKLQEVLDVDRYVSHLVCEIFTSHVDGYAVARNNYRIYRNPETDRFTFIGHGVDWAFQNSGVSIRPPLGSDRPPVSARRYPTAGMCAE
jgi:spore coat protein CotH